MPANPVGDKRACVFVEEEQMECRTKDELEQHLSGPADRSVAADILLRDEPEEEEDEEERDGDEEDDDGEDGYSE